MEMGSKGRTSWMIFEDGQGRRFGTGVLCTVYFSRRISESPSSEGILRTRGGDWCGEV